MSFLPLRLIKDDHAFDFMGIRRYSFAITFFILISSFTLLLTKSLNFGIDFTGGILIEARMDPAPDLAEIREDINSLEIGDVNIQNFGSDKDIMFRIGNQSRDRAEQMTDIETIKTTLKEKFDGDIEYRKIDFVGPQVGKELIWNGFLAMTLSMVAIMIYIWARFEWQFGVGVILALFHDTVASLGFLSITGLDFDLYSIAAILAVIGYSVNDSVVIYDRIRENMRKFKSKPIKDILNLSINETLSRTILTVLTTLLAVLALILFGGDVIFSFSTTVFFGICVGTYSSIYISAPVLTMVNLKHK